MSGQPPTTFEAIEAAALRHPDKAAVVDGPLRTSYAELHRDVINFSRLLAQRGVRRGQCVAMSSALALGRHLVAVIACENLGAASACFAADEGPAGEPLLRRAHWVIADALPPLAPAERQIQLDDALMREAAGLGASGPAPRAVLAADEPQRIVRTSGSTGAYRMMVFPRRLQEYWIASAARTAGYTPDSCLLLASPIFINVGLARACACLRLGGTVLRLRPTELEGWPVTHFWSLPMHLEHFLAALPANHARRLGLRAMTGGGFLSARLRALALERFCSRLDNRYGCNEVEAISDNLDAGGEGELAPGVEVRIVDESGAHLPAGTAGAVEVRTPAMVQGYLDDPAATAAAFRDGWFRTGDRAALVGPRRIRVDGRQDDMINLSGVKVPAVVLEGRIRAVAGVADVAVIAINAGAGRATTGFALVPVPGTDTPGLLHRLAQDVKLGHGFNVQADVVFLQALPRLPGGKVDRGALHAHFRR